MAASQVESVSATPVVPARRRLNAEERRVQILDAARQVFIEQGAKGARARLIAERAGITEAYLYRRFDSMEQLYALAVDVPLRALIEELQTEVHELASHADVSRWDVLVRCHELFLEHMAGIAPLFAAALTNDVGAEQRLYTDQLYPALRDVLELIIPDISGWPIEVFDMDVLVQAHLGVHLGLALEHLLNDDEPLNVHETARQLALLFGKGVHGAAPRPNA